MRIIAGLQEPDAGKILSPRHATFGFLPQDGLTFHERPLFEETRSVFSHVLSAESSLRELEAKLETLKETDDAYQDTMDQYDRLMEAFHRWDGYRIDAEIGRVLEGLGFHRDDWSKPCDQFSGGWQMRIALAKLLLERPSMLLLDEPTNHLDLEARDWLKTYLSDYPAAVLLVSHDRHFLDKVVRRCSELFNGKLTDYHGNFSYFEEERERRYLALEEAARRQQEEIEKTERFIERFRYKNTKATQVQSRVKQLEKIERIVLPPKPPKVAFQFPDPPRPGRVVMELKGIDKAYGDNQVLENLELVLERGEKTALVGVNGAGKSTLMRIIAEQDTYEGERTEGYQVNMGFFAQDQRKVLNPKHTILQSLEEVAPIDMVPRLRSILGAFLFRGDDVYKKVSVLSGGERSRVALARMLLQPYNVLLLDEPTNHLDIHAQEVLLKALKSFNGTVLFVSHDRFFIDELAEGVIEVHDGIAERFIGNYADYVRTKINRGEWTGAQDGVQWTTQSKGEDIEQAVPVATSSQAANVDPARATRQQQYHEVQEQRRALAKKKRQLTSQISTLERTLEEREAQVEEMETKMAAPGFYDNFEEANQVTETYQSMKKGMEADYETWETLSFELAELEEESPEE
jgi:ATP-binding cassette subfamily F protein 3